MDDNITIHRTHRIYARMPLLAGRPVLCPYWEDRSDCHLSGAIKIEKAGPREAVSYEVLFSWPHEDFDEDEDRPMGAAWVPCEVILNDNPKLKDAS